MADCGSSYTETSLEDALYTHKILSELITSWLCLDDLTQNEYKLPEQGVFDFDRCRYLLPKDKTWFHGKRFVQIRFNEKVVRQLFVIGTKEKAVSMQHIIIQESIERTNYQTYHYYFPIQLSDQFQQLWAFSYFRNNYRDDPIQVVFFCGSDNEVLVLQSDNGNPVEQMMLHLDLPIPIEKEELKILVEQLDSTLYLPKELLQLIAQYVPGSIPDHKSHKPGWHLCRTITPVTPSTIHPKPNGQPESIFD